MHFARQSLQNLVNQTKSIWPSLALTPPSSLPPILGGLLYSDFVSFQEISWDGWKIDEGLVGDWWGSRPRWVIND
eukprot:10718147-Karenia_brevis.AAC.1